ncbi:MAG: histidine triad nucleotide-binding protein [SAR202 cluster bacterium]|jgi:histidine triad (HIT) family protein|nr:histidine triad nucleotide-binding protein [SAR202 cluster bacterium]MDP6514384.1 histidine triad nucleotide-binding protein [SAR202 cluster bacterium]MDP6715414.1 histidine triad nucleotide-binding protein [SAR202 cluster bacterium]
MAEDCLFCKIRDGEIPSDILHRDEHCFVIRDIAPTAPVHLLVIPVQHFTYLTGMTQEFQPTIGAMFAVAKELADAEGIVECGYRLVINQGKNSGQQVPHLHLHVLGGRPMGPLA